MTSLKKARRERGLSQRGLAQLAGAPFRTIQLLEKGGHDPRLSTIQKIALGLGLPRSALEKMLTRLLETPPDSVVFTSRQIEEEGEDRWKTRFFNFVDAFRKHPTGRFVQDPPDQETSPRIQALLASTVETLCEETGTKIPAWCESVPPLSHPWFVSGIENLKATAIVESPVRFRQRNIFVLDNFLRRV